MRGEVGRGPRCLLLLVIIIIMIIIFLVIIIIMIMRGEVGRGPRCLLLPCHNNNNDNNIPCHNNNNNEGGSRKGTQVPAASLSCCTRMRPSGQVFEYHWRVPKSASQVSFSSACFIVMHYYVWRLEGEILPLNPQASRQRIYPKHQLDSPS